MMMTMTAVGNLNSNVVYPLLTATKGAPLTSNAVILAYGSQDNAGKFYGKSLEHVRMEDSQDVRISNNIHMARQWEKNVVSHEKSHMLVGGEFAGAPSYIYSKGPDGKLYIVGGEVSMRIPAGGSLEQQRYALQRVKKAAMSPENPSSQDMRTAAMAASREAAVNLEIAKRKALKSYEKDVQEHMDNKKNASIEAFRKFKYREISSFELAV